MAVVAAVVVKTGAAALRRGAAGSSGICGGHVQEGLRDGVSASLLSAGRGRLVLHKEHNTDDINTRARPASAPQGTLARALGKRGRGHDIHPIHHVSRQEGDLPLPS